MGQPLTGTEVQATYEALLKTPNNTTLVPGNTEPITDGAGNESALHLGINQVKLKGEYVQIESQSGQSGIVADAGTPSAAEINYYGTHSFQSATVEGLPFQTDYQISATDNGFGATIDITAQPSQTVTSSVQLLAGTNVTIDTTGNVMTINAAGGGGGSATVGGPIETLPWRARPANEVWISPYLLSGYGQSAGQSLDNPNQMHFIPFFAVPGKSLKNAYLNVATPQAGALLNIGLYKAVEISGVLYPSYVAALGTSVDASTGGNKTFLSGGNVTLPTDAANNMYFLGIQTSVGGIQLMRWTDPVAWGVLAYDIYRYNAVRYQAASFSLPTGNITNEANYGDATTDGAFVWYFQYN